jgi:hypothetical protein
MSQTPPLQVMNWVSIASGGAVVPAGVVPVPLSGTVCGLPGALSVSVNAAVRVPACEGENVIETLQLAPAASVSPEQPSSTSVKSSVLGTAALFTKSEAEPVFVTVTDCGALVVPVSRVPKVSDVGENETAGDEVVVDGVQPESVVEADVEPSLTVTRQVEELYELASILKAPLPSLVPVTEPGVTTTAWFGSAPLPSTRSCVPFSSARVRVIAACALTAATPNATTAAAATTALRDLHVLQRRMLMRAPLGVRS